QTGDVVFAAVVVVVLLDGSASGAGDDSALSKGENYEHWDAHEEDVGEDEVPVVQVEPGAGHLEQVQRQRVLAPSDDKERVEHVVPDVEADENRRGRQYWAQ